jgi:hypothetical protein
LKIKYMKLTTIPHDDSFTSKVQLWMTFFQKDSFSQRFKETNIYVESDVLTAMTIKSNIFSDETLYSQDYTGSHSRK